MSLKVLTADRRQALDLLDDDRTDLALGWFDEKRSHLNAELLMEESLFCVFRPDHPLLKRRRRLNIEQTLSFPHLNVGATGQRTAAFDDLLLRHGLRRQARVTVANFTAVPYLLISSDMIGVFTKLASDVFEKSFGLAKRPVPINVGKISANMVWQMRNDKDLKRVWLREQIKAVYKSLRQL